MLYKELSKEEMMQQLAMAKDIYGAFIKNKQNIDISRGKPCKEQLDLSNEMLSIIKDLPIKGVDIRNYGGLEGLPELRELFAKILGVEQSNVLVGGNSSLSMMYDTVQRALQFGINGEKPWNSYKKIKFLCPSPGYDRHFSICEIFGIEMIAVPMDDNGPIMDIVESYVATDDTIKGMWCVPKYSNPTGVTYSDCVVDRLVSMKTAAKDFRLFWDNAYAIHDLYEDKDVLKNAYAAAKERGTEDRLFMFTSTSKITFAGAGMACMAMSENNLLDATRSIKMQTIGPDKVKQYMHVLFLKDYLNTLEHMKKHAEIIRPKFLAVVNALQAEFGDNDIARWTNPNGGYFISYDVLAGCAKRVYTLCKDSGLVLTTCGATYPLGIDDNDSNIRIAPTFTTAEELTSACKILIVATKVACLEKLLEEKE